MFSILIDCAYLHKLKKKKTHKHFDYIILWLEI